MIQATDFVCPVCKAQVSKPCVELEPVYRYGRMEFRAAGELNKPHPERRRLAKAKREKQQGAAA